MATNASYARRLVTHLYGPCRTTLLACETGALRWPLRFALLAALALLAAVLALLRIGYETNDDVFLSMIASGRGFCLRPDEHLIFSNVLVGQVLKWLYQHWRGFPWYGSYLTLAHYAAHVAILYCALTIHREPAGSAVTGSASESARRSFRRRLAMYLICFLLGEVVLLNSLQYTSTAFVAAQAGIFLLWLGASRLAKAGQGSAAAPLAAAVLFIVLSGLIRIESLAMAVLAAAPLLGYLAFSQPRRAVVWPAAVGCVAGLLVLAAAKYDAAHYAADPAWRHFHAFNRLRYKFNDYGWTSYTPETAAIFSAVGWSKNDHDMLTRYYFDDPEFYSEARMSAVLDAHPWKTARLTPGYFVDFLRRVLRDRAVWSVVLALPFLLAGLGGRRNERLVILACCGMSVLLIAMLTLNNKVPPVRVYFPLVTFPLFATLLFPAAGAAPWPNAARGLRDGLRSWWLQPRWARAVVAMLVIGMVMGAFKQVRRSAKNESGRAAIERFIVEAQKQPDKLYVCWEAAFPFEFISPFDSLASWEQVRTLNLSWMQRTPWVEEMKRRYRVEDTAAALYQRDDLVLTATDEHKALYEVFVREHYGAAVEFVPWHEAGKKKFVAGRFQLRSSDVEAASGRVPGRRR